LIEFELGFLFYENTKKPDEVLVIDEEDEEEPEDKMP